MIDSNDTMIWSSHVLTFSSVRWSLLRSSWSRLPSTGSGLGPGGSLLSAHDLNMTEVMKQRSSRAAGKVRDRLDWRSSSTSPMMPPDVALERWILLLSSHRRCLWILWWFRPTWCCSLNSHKVQVYTGTHTLMHNFDFSCFHMGRVVKIWSKFKKQLEFTNFMYHFFRTLTFTPFFWVDT